MNSRHFPLAASETEIRAFAHTTCADGKVIGSDIGVRTATTGLGIPPQR
jgi:hypothetical protein